MPPVSIPLGGAGIGITSGVGTFAKWSLICRAPGGLKVSVVAQDNVGFFDVWISDTSPFGATTGTASHNYAFGQTVQSIFTSNVLAAKVAPVGVFATSQQAPSLGWNWDNWVGPGQFFNIEDRIDNRTRRVNVFWKEYPSALNP